MLIQLKKFGATLVSRPAGREAYMAFAPTMQGTKKGEKIEVDFEGVEVLTPSWADEFLSKLISNYKSQVLFKNTQNASVIESLKILNLISP